ncbi:MAG: UDP-N-acetylmuramoyl-tripeptide--D-alanyl-D-alanine ligase [Oscillospiraceae bacterium]|nr:UDP-N-acetylmuramoyl-tripeptide--D-alanyl-D-alanine ligase [Oscillospiraceae bacterium]
MTIERAARLCGGRIAGACEPETELGAIVIDSRAVRPGDLFAAYKGERADGHDYIAAAFGRGAACCLAERVPEGETRPLLLVESVQAAVEAIAAGYRETLSLPVVGITGSVGKTSAKEMIASVLSQRLRVLKTEANLNNHIGVPMTISRIAPEHEAAVVEMGISGFGEMTRLTQIARPDIAVFTVIGHAHLEYLHDLDGVLRAKTEMLDGMAADAPALVNGDDEKLRGLVCRQKKLCFGLGENNDLRAENVRALPDGGTACELAGLGRRIAVTIPAFGRHLLYAALEGALVGILLGLSDEEIAAGVAAFEVVGRRGAVTDTDYVTLIDDCYNANPDSCRSAIDSLLALPGRHVCILGDMLELGPESARMHYELGRYAAERGAELVLTTGELSAETARGAGERSIHYVNRDALIGALPAVLRRGDAVLVKASHGARFDAISEAIKELRG